MKHRCLLVLLCIPLPASIVAGQEFTGRVMDSTGGLLPKATVVAHNVDTGVNQTTLSTGSGEYTIPYLKPGNYTVTADYTGFEKELRTGIVLQVGQTATVNFALKVGSTSQTVTVQGGTVIDFNKADGGEVVENTRVTELPLNGRDPGMLSQLVAGADWQGYIGYQRPFDDTQQQLSVNGGGKGNTALQIDGVSNSVGGINETGLSRISYVPPVDSVQEFKIITNPFDAKFGLLAGGVEDVTLKSGTNTLHGDVYEFARRTFLDANTWQNDWNIARATPGTDVSQFQTTKHKLDQYGFELDGPIFIPKVYNGRNKTFFTMQYENWNEISPNTTTNSVPSPQWLTGDFTNLVYWTGSAYAPITLYDPLTNTENPDGSYSRIPFGPTDPIDPTPVTNIIPATRINPFSAKLLSYYPKPNTTPAAGSNPFANNYTLATPATNKYRNVLGKVDENLSAKDRLSLRYGYWERFEVRSNGIPGPAGSGLLPHKERSHSFTLEETHTFTPSLLFDFRANVTVREDAIQNGPIFDPTALGWTPDQVAAMGNSAAAEFPYFQVSEFASLGQNGTGAQVSNNLSLLPSVTWVKDKHTLRAGLDARFWQSGNPKVSGGNNIYVDRQWSQFNCGTCNGGNYTPDTGNSIASVLLGNATSGSNTINSTTFWSAHYWAPFLQDDWKISRRLTLNLGIRWDFLPSETERHNRTNGAFNTTLVNPISSEVTIPGYGQFLGGVTFAGVNGRPRSGYSLVKDNIQPRVGFAYAIDDKTVFRGGFGESMRMPQVNFPSFGYSATTSYVSSDPTMPGNTYPNLANQLNNPYPQVIQPSGSSQGALEQLGQTPWTVNPHYLIPSFWNYSLGIQRQFLQRDVVTASYVGSRLYNGDSNNNINRESAAAYVPCNPQLGGNPNLCNNDNVPNPFIGINGFQGSGYYQSATINALNFTRPFPQFGDIQQWQENDSRTWYNSFQLTGLHQWNNSITFHGTWTWSKLMDAGGFADETYQIRNRYLDGSDHTHRITISSVYMLPVGRGRTFLSNANRFVDEALGGWELSGLYIYATGTPWSNAPNNQLHSAWVPRHIEQATGYIRVAAACAEQYQQINGVEQLVQLPFQYDGACPRGAVFQNVPSYGETTNNIYTGVRVPATHQFDTSLAKNFSVVERLNLQIRIDAFNVLNHPLWSENPNNNTNDSNFGTIERGPWGQSNLPREVQLSAKLVW